jgi:hypothetical protein
VQQTGIHSGGNSAVSFLLTAGAVLSVILLAGGSLLLRGHSRAAPGQSRLAHEPARLNLARLGGRLTLLQEMDQTVGSHQHQMANCLELLTLQNEKIILLQSQNRHLRDLAKGCPEGPSTTEPLSDLGH